MPKIQSNTNQHVGNFPDSGEPRWCPKLENRCAIRVQSVARVGRVFVVPARLHQDALGHFSQLAFREFPGRRRQPGFTA